MKQSFWKKLAVFLGLAVGALTMTACQSTSIITGSGGTVKFDQTSSQVFTDTAGDKYVVINSYIYNNTIYDIKTWDYTVTAKAGSVDLPEIRVTDKEFYVGHGANGYATVTAKLGTEYSAVTSVSFKDCVPNQVKSAWDTYLGWWIVGFVIIGISLLCFAVELFGNRLTKDQAIQAFREHAASTVCIFLFIFILCMFPLFFGAWVPTVILVITMACVIVGGGLLTGLKALTSKNK